MSLRSDSDREAEALSAAAESLRATHTWCGLPCRLVRIPPMHPGVAVVDFGGGRPLEAVRRSELQPRTER